jgi:hypothetical protein
MRRWAAPRAGGRPERRGGGPARAAPRPAGAKTLQRNQRNPRARKRAHEERAARPRGGAQRGAPALPSRFGGWQHRAARGPHRGPQRARMRPGHAPARQPQDRRARAPIGSPKAVARWDALTPVRRAAFARATHPERTPGPAQALRRASWAAAPQALARSFAAWCSMWTPGCSAPAADPRLPPPAFARCPADQRPARPEPAQRPPAAAASAAARPARP